MGNVKVFPHLAACNYSLKHMNECSKRPVFGDYIICDDDYNDSRQEIPLTVSRASNRTLSFAIGCFLLKCTLELITLCF